MIAVIDYKMGNLLSVERGVRAALDALGRQNIEVKTTSCASEIERAQAIVLPGVGAFADAAASMNNLGQMSVVRQRIKAGVPFLGICLGLHLLCEFGVEGAVDAGGEEAAEAEDVARAGVEELAEVQGAEDIERAEGADQPLDAESNKMPGMGFIKETVYRLPAHDAQGNFYKIPHVGWDTVQPNAGCESFNSPLFDGVKPGEYFYFTHSYYVPVCAQTIATTTHSTVMSSAVQVAPRAFAVQFHPEKSSDAGAKFLQNFFVACA